MDTLSGEAIRLKLFFHRSEKRSMHVKRKESAPLGSKFFPFIEDAFSEGLGVQENKQEVSKVLALVKYGGKLTSNQVGTLYIFLKLFVFLLKIVPRTKRK